MKKLFLLSTRPWIYLTEIPLLTLLTISIKYNEVSASITKLYPLIITSSLGIIFIFLYFFKFITLSKEEARIFSLFGERDKALINKDKTLIIKKHSRFRIEISLFGNDGSGPALDWLKDDEDYDPNFIMFKGRALGGFGTVKKILRHYGISADAADAVVETGTVFEDDALLSWREGNDDDGEYTVKLKFKKTL